MPSPPPFLSLSLAGKDVLGGVNFASGGAGILNETGVYFVRHESLWLSDSPPVMAAAPV